MRFAICLVALAMRVGAQSPAMETGNDMFAKLTPEEKTAYQAAAKDFGAQKFGDSLAVFKTLLAAHPGDPFLSKMMGESAANTGDLKLALEVMAPVERQSPDDWQASGLMTRIYAELGDKKNRDAEFVHMGELFKKGLIPKGMTQYIVEKDKVEGKQVMIWKSFEPWGNFKVYNYARVFDAEGKLLQRITLESADFDQALWAKSHAKEAAAGGRLFSLDGYSDGGVNAAGQHTETHATYGFLDGQPTYDDVRARFLGIASGKGGAMSSNTHANP